MNNSKQNKQKYRVQANILKVLAHPTRLSIINALMEGPKCVNDVCELCEVPQPNISQHLTLLKGESIVQYYEEGKSKCYYLTNKEMIKTILNAFEIRQVETKKCCK